jgi:hypothetical protein
VPCHKFDSSMHVASMAKVASTSHSIAREDQGMVGLHVRLQVNRR